MPNLINLCRRSIIHCKVALKNLNAYIKVYTKPRIRYFSLLEAGGYKKEPILTKKSVNHHSVRIYSLQYQIF